MRIADRSKAQTVFDAQEGEGARDSRKLYRLYKEESLCGLLVKLVMNQRGE